MECDQIRFTFQHCPFCSLHTSSIGVAVLGDYLLKSHHMTFLACPCITSIVWSLKFSTTLIRRSTLLNMLTVSLVKEDKTPPPPKKG